MSSIPSRKELWACSGPKGLLAGVSKVLAGAKQETKSSSCDPSLECVLVSGERGTQGHPEGSFSPVGSAAAMGSNTSRKNKVPHPSVWPGSQEPRLPRNLGCFQGPWRPGPGGSTMDSKLTLTGCVAQVEALQINPDCQSPAAQPPRQNTGSGLCGKPQARGPDILQQEQPNGFPNLAAICGLPSLANPLHIPQDQRCPGSILDLSQLREEPTTLNVQAHVSVEDQPLQLNSRAIEQAAQRGQLDL